MSYKKRFLHSSLITHNSSLTDLCSPVICNITGAAKAGGRNSNHAEKIFLTGVEAVNNQPVLTRFAVRQVCKRAVLRVRRTHLDTITAALGNAGPANNNFSYMFTIYAAHISWRSQNT